MPNPIRRNLGFCPDDAKGKRIVVKLRNGRVCGLESVTSVSPPGWAADTTRWTLEDGAFDVVQFRVI